MPDGLDPQVPGQPMRRAVRTGSDRFTNGFDQKASLLQCAGVCAERTLVAGELHRDALTLNEVFGSPAREVRPVHHEGEIVTFSSPDARVGGMEYRQHEATTRPEYPACFTYCSGKIIHVDQAVVSDCQVERVVGKGKVRRVGDGVFTLRMSSARGTDQCRRRVHPGDTVPTGSEIPRDAALAAAEIQCGPSGVRDQFEEGGPITPVRIKLGCSHPGDPVPRLLFPRLTG